MSYHQLQTIVRQRRAKMLFYMFYISLLLPIIQGTGECKAQEIIKETTELHNDDFKELMTSRQPLTYLDSSIIKLLATAIQTDEQTPDDAAKKIIKFATSGRRIIDLKTIIDISSKYDLHLPEALETTTAAVMAQGAHKPINERKILVYATDKHRHTLRHGNNTIVINKNAQAPNVPSLIIDQEPISQETIAEATKMPQTRVFPATASYGVNRINLDTYINGSCTVRNITQLPSLYALNSSSFGVNLTVSGDLIAKNLRVTSTASVSWFDALGTSLFHKDVTVSGSTTLVGPVLLKSSLMNTSTATVGWFDALGTSIFHKDVTVSGSTTLRGLVNLSSLNVTGTAIVGWLDTLGTALFHKDVTVSGSTTLVGPVLLKSSLMNTSTATVGWFDALGTSIFHKDITVSGSTTLVGPANARSIRVTGTATVGWFDALGTSNFHKDVTVSGSTTLVGSTIMGRTSSDTAEIHSRTRITGTTTIAANLGVIGQFNIGAENTSPGPIGAGLHVPQYRVIVRDIQQVALSTTPATVISIPYDTGSFEGRIKVTVACSESGASNTNLWYTGDFLISNAGTPVPVILNENTTSVATPPPSGTILQASFDFTGTPNEYLINLATTETVASSPAALFTYIEIYSYSLPGITGLAMTSGGDDLF